MDKPKILATALLCASLIWTTFLIYDVRRRPNPPSERRQLGLLYHNIPALLFLITTIIAESAKDTALVWFVALIVFRYWRTLTNIWFWFQYELAVTPYARYTGADCTVIVPTVGPAGNGAFDEMVAAILVNRPARPALGPGSTTVRSRYCLRLT